MVEFFKLFTYRKSPIPCGTHYGRGLTPKPAGGLGLAEYDSRHYRYRSRGRDQRFDLATVAAQSVLCSKTLIRSVCTE
jgi:hypothetical protein